jgi:hypothetical protein
VSRKNLKRERSVLYGTIAEFYEEIEENLGNVQLILSATRD